MGKQTFKPHEYQKYCISRLIADSKVGLFLDMRFAVNQKVKQ